MFNLRAFVLFLFAVVVSPAGAFTPTLQVLALNPQIATIGGITAQSSQNWAKGGNPISNGTCGSFGHEVPCLTTTTRASVGYVSDAGGVWTSVATGVRRNSNLGLLVEEARTNSGLWARDMTNAAWVKVGMGTALNAVGIDGTANSATTLTATGTASSCTASCTALQTITLGSASDTFSVFLKRVTGSGAVNITINNLVGTTACTLTTTDFTRCSVNSTLANPVFGVQLTALNDVVIADFNQLEAGASVTSPILTTTVAVARATDVVVLTNLPTFGSAYTLYGKGTPQPPIGYSLTGVVLSVDDGTTTNRTQIARQSSTQVANYFVGGGGNGTGAAWAQNVSGKLVAGFAVSDQAGSFNGATIFSTASAVMTSPITFVHIGVNGAGNGGWNGFVEYTAIPSINARLPNGQLQSMTTAGP